MDMLIYLNFTLAAIALLASPGPAYATVVAIGRSVGWQQGQMFNFGLQLGMAIVAALTAFGMATIVLLYPTVKTGLGFIGVSYLLYLAFKIATAPVGKTQNGNLVPASFWMGAVVGLTNPKAYVAQSSLFASFHLLPETPVMDGGIKWASAVVVMSIAGFGWLWLGAKLKSVPLNLRGERLLNLTFAAIIFGTGISVIAM